MSKRIGNPDSKYAYSPEKLDRDIADKQHEHKVFKDMIRHLVLMDPSKIELRYQDVVEAMIEIKKEFNL